MSLNISIKNAEKDLNDIMEAIERNEDDKIIFDSYDTLNVSLLKIIKEKDKKWIEKFFRLIYKNLIEMLNEKKRNKYKRHTKLS